MASKRLAVLIDADNASASRLPSSWPRSPSTARPTIRRAYGDWTTQNLAGWKDQLLRHAIQPIQQFAYTRGKNATDSSLIIDAMDVLYADNVDGFAIVSSDSDFTRLATRLRESGKTVYGLGRRETPDAFVQACDRFIYLDLLGAEPPAKARRTPTLEKLLRAAITGTAKVDGWALLVRGRLVPEHAATPGSTCATTASPSSASWSARRTTSRSRRSPSAPGVSRLQVRLQPRSARGR